MTDTTAILAWLEAEGSPEGRAGMGRYGIPSDRAFGVPMGVMKRYAKTLGKDAALARDLWQTGYYEARTLAVFVMPAAELTPEETDAWCADFDNWAICDTACFSLFDQTSFAWSKVGAWAPSPELYVRRAAFALVWALSVHDKAADDQRFIAALSLIADSPADDRPHVKKAVDMALRAVGKRNTALNKAARVTAARMKESGEKSKVWIGQHAIKELESDAVQNRLNKKRS